MKLEGAWGLHELTTRKVRTRASRGFREVEMQYRAVQRYQAPTRANREKGEKKALKESSRGQAAVSCSSRMPGSSTSCCKESRASLGAVALATSGRVTVREKNLTYTCFSFQPLHFCTFIPRPYSIQQSNKYQTK